MKKETFGPPKRQVGPSLEDFEHYNCVDKIRLKRILTYLYRSVILLKFGLGRGVPLGNLKHHPYQLSRKQEPIHVPNQLNLK